MSPILCFPVGVLLLLLHACSVPPSDDSAPAGGTDSAADSAPAPPPDADGDGVVDTEDCAPTDPAIHPGAAERANGLDDDCDNVVDAPVGVGTAATQVAGRTATDGLGAAALRLDGRLWIGAPGATLAEGGEGRLLGFDLPADGTLGWEAAAAEVRGETGGGGLGSRLHAADLDGDGRPELCASLPGTAEVDCFDPSFSDVASPRAAVFRFESGRNRDGFGLALAGGDFDGNGTADLAIGAPATDGAGGENDADAGAIYLALDAATAGDAALGIASMGPFRGAAAGTALVAEDLDGDGLPSLIVGVPIADFAGRVYLLDGAPPANLGDQPPWFEGATPGDGAGTTLAAGDTDGDGYGDVILGLPGAEAVGLVYGSPGAGAGTGVALDATLRDPAATGFGASVALVDPDGDGRPAVAVGAVGRVSVFPGPFLGSSDQTSLVLDATGHGPLTVSTGGDLLAADPAEAGLVWLFPSWSAR